MDSKDEKILAELYEDSRQSTADIARKTGIPRVTVHERIQRLKKQGVIEKFTIKRNYSALSIPSTAFVLVSYSNSKGSSERKVTKEIAGIPEVKEVQIIGGEWDLLVKIRGQSIEEIGKLVLDKIREIKGVDKTLTLSVWETVKEEY